MIHKKEQMPVQIRPQMRGGKGQAQITTLFAPEEITSSVRMCAQIRLQPGCSIGCMNMQPRMKFIICCRVPVW